MDGRRAQDGSVQSVKSVIFLFLPSAHFSASLPHLVDMAARDVLCDRKRKITDFTDCTDRRISLGLERSLP